MSAGWGAQGWYGDLDPGTGGGSPDDPGPPPEDGDPTPDEPNPPESQPTHPEPEPIVERIPIWEWVVVGDDRTCPVCWPLNGLRFEGDEGPWPPAHINCRCRRVLVAYDERITGYAAPAPDPWFGPADGGGWGDPTGGSRGGGGRR